MGRREPADIRSVAYGRVAEDAPLIGASAIRSKPVRMSLDIEPITHAQFTSWLGRAALRVHQPVTNVQVFRAMLDLLLDETNPEFAAMVLAQLQARPGK